MPKKKNKKSTILESEEQDRLVVEDEKGKKSPPSNDELPTQDEPAPEELTEESVKAEQEEIQRLEDAIALEPDRLSDGQKEIIRRNKDKLPPEQIEYYKDLFEEKKEEPKLEPDYKKKFSESSREAQKKTAANRIINKAISDAESVPEPTEKELQTEYSDWDVMSETEKLLAKETLISRRWRENISKAKEQVDKVEKWNESVDEFVEDPKTLNEYSELEGKEDNFSEFAKQEENNNVPMKVLVGAFLHENSIGKVKNKGLMFVKGSGGPNEKPKPKSDKLTLEEGRKLRETDYNKWKGYVKAGKIEVNL